MILIPGEESGHGQACTAGPEGGWGGQTGTPSARKRHDSWPSPPRTKASRPLHLHVSDCSRLSVQLGVGHGPEEPSGQVPATQGCKAADCSPVARPPAATKEPQDTPIGAQICLVSAPQALAKPSDKEQRSGRPSEGRADLPRDNGKSSFSGHPGARHRDVEGGVRARAARASPPLLHPILGPPSHLLQVALAFLPCHLRRWSRR